MRSNFLLAVAAAAVVLTPQMARATTFVLTFAGLMDGESVGSFYNADGITFSANAFASIENNSGGTGNFQGEPTPPTAVFFETGGPDIIDISGGFTNFLSFFYTGITATGKIDVWSGLDATGTLLATLDVPITASELGTGPCTVADFCPFFGLAVTFPGTAHSVDFGGAADEFFFDNITVGANITSPEPAPEPGTIGLFAAALTGAAWARRRRRCLPMLSRMRLLDIAGPCHG